MNFAKNRWPCQYQKFSSVAIEVYNSRHSIIMIVVSNACTRKQHWRKERVKTFLNIYKYSAKYLFTGRVCFITTTLESNEICKFWDTWFKNNTDIFSLRLFLRRFHNRTGLGHTAMLNFVINNENMLILRIRL